MRTHISTLGSTCITSRYTCEEEDTCEHTYLHWVAPVSQAYVCAFVCDCKCKCKRVTGSACSCSHRCSGKTQFICALEMLKEVEGLGSLNLKGKAKVRV
jgi:hypothetical protein